MNSPSAKTTSVFVAWLVAAALYIAVSYPYQATVLPWLTSAPQVVYALVCIVGIGMVCLLPGPTSHELVKYTRSVYFLMCLLIGAMLATFILSRNSTVIRDFLLLGLIIALAFRAQSAFIVRVIRALTYLSTILYIPAMVVVVLFYAGAIDWPTWGIERLGLDPNNPLVVRNDAGSYQYHLPLWLALIPHGEIVDQGFGLHFVRQPLLYIEPTDTWLYSSGLFWYAVADTKLAARRLCIATLGCALLVSFSVAGVLATIAGIACCITFVLGGRTLVSLLLVGIALVLTFLPIEQILGLVGSNKAAEYSFYSENVSVLTNLSIFGNAFSQDDQPLSYGFLIVLDRYGIVGSIAFISVLVGMSVASFRLLGSSLSLGWRRYPLFIGCFISIAMLTKYPGIIPAMPAICLAAGLALQELRLGAFMQSLIGTTSLHQRVVQ